MDPSTPQSHLLLDHSNMRHPVWPKTKSPKSWRTNFWTGCEDNNILFKFGFWFLVTDYYVMKRALLNLRNNYSLTKFDKGIGPSCSVDSMAILIVEFLWQILQEGVGQFLIEASITERQKTGILLNYVAEKKKII